MMAESSPCAGSDPPNIQTICGNEEISTEIVNKERSDVPLTECDDTDRDIQTSYGTDEFSAEIVNVKTSNYHTTHSLISENT
jgi:hypothetical protein